MTRDCTCDSCVAACHTKPGVFAHGEAEQVAEYLNVPLQDLYDRYLMLEVWYDDEAPATGKDVWCLAPGTTNAPTGTRSPAWFQGTCVFLENDRCTIHSVKPAECAQAHHEVPREVANKQRHDVIFTWQDHQDQIVALNGEPPQPHDPLDLLFGLFGAMEKRA